MNVTDQVLFGVNVAGIAGIPPHLPANIIVMQLRELVAQTMNIQ